MRVVILATVLLASSSLCPSLAQEAEKPTIAAPQTAPSQPDQNSQQQREQRTERGRPREDDREIGRDWRMRRGDGERMGREDRDTGPNGEDTVSVIMIAKATRIAIDTAIGTIEEVGIARTEDGTTATTMTKIGLAVAWKICIEYENGDEYCRYKGH
jgi:hypothetical protein